MADKTISALTAASTPLAGTEVLPIVQSSTTKKVAADDLTVKNIRSNATTGILQVAGPAAAATRVMTVPDANFTAARTDAANSFTGNQTLANGNLVIGTAGKGIDFSANTNATGMTSELLTWYEEGTWTPILIFDGAATGITYSVQNGTYTRIGRLVTGRFIIVLTSKGSATGAAAIAALPFLVGGDLGSAVTMLCSNFASSAPTQGYCNSSSNQIVPFVIGATGVTGLTDANFNNNTRLDMWFQYFV